MKERTKRKARNAALAATVVVAVFMLIGVVAREAYRDGVRIAEDRVKAQIINADANGDGVVTMRWEINRADNGAGDVTVTGAVIGEGE